MNPKLLLCLALVLCSGLFGCSSIDHQSANSNQPPPHLYLHLIASSFAYPKPPRLILSARVPLSSDFDIPMVDNRHLDGRIDPRNEDYFGHFQARLCSGTNVFDGNVELEKRYTLWPQPYDVKAPFICQPLFILSSNPDPKSFLEQQAAAEKKQWHFDNPLTARQLARVKKQFKLMRPGMTKDEVFALLGLSRYRSRLLPGCFFSPKLNRSTYKVADGEILTLVFDYTGYDKTNRLELANGEHIMMLDLTGTHTNRLVIEAQLGMETWPKENGVSNAPPVWH